MFKQNDVISIRGIKYRILFVKGIQVWLYDIDKDNDGIKYSIEDSLKLRELFDKGELFLEKDPYEDLRVICSNKDTEKIEKSYNLIGSFISNTEILYSKTELSKAVKAIANGNMALKRKIYRVIGRWFQRGQCKGALIPDYRAVGKAIRNYTRNPGKKGPVATPVLTSDIKGLMAKVIHDYVLIENGLSLTKAYSEFILKYHKRFSEEQMIPSIHQFKNFYYTYTNRRERNKGRNSSRVFNKDIAAKMGSVNEACFGPGEYYEIDSTVDNVYLVSSNDTACAIGRPVLYTVTDRYTGLLVGFSVQLESAQYKSAAEALYCAVSDKKHYFKDTFGIDLPFEWNVSGIPAHICADNAELEGGKIEVFARAFGVTITNTSPYRADQKGTVESSIGLIQKELREFTYKSGVSPVKTKKAGGTDNRTNGIYTLNEYREMVLEAVHIINGRVRRKMPKDFPIGYDWSPIALWKWSLSTKPSFLHSVSDALRLRLSLLPQAAASISREGIKCKHITYSCQKLEEKGWFDRDKDSKKQYKPVIVLDDGNVANAWIYPDPIHEPRTFYRCKLAPVSSYLDGCCLYEAEQLLAIASNSKQRTSSVQNFKRAVFRERQKQKMAAAEERKQSITDAPKEKEQIAYIRSNRNDEMIRDSRLRSSIDCLDNKPTNEVSDASKSDPDDEWSIFDHYSEYF